MGKRYYWLKLKEDFFREARVTLLFREPRGKEILLFYIFLLLQSFRTDGELRYNEARGFTEREWSLLTRFPPSLVRKALERLEECGFLTREENGVLFMNDLEEMVGSETDAAIRKRRQREQQRDNVQERKRKDIELKIEKNRDLKKEIEAFDVPRSAWESI